VIWTIYMVLKIDYDIVKFQKVTSFL